jgi:hypothetical protein
MLEREVSFKRREISCRLSFMFSTFVKIFLPDIPKGLGFTSKNLEPQFGLFISLTFGTISDTQYLLIIA